MTPEQAGELLKLLAAAYPSRELGRETATLYTEYLVTQRYDTARAAMIQLVQTSKFLPTIAEIREAIDAQRPALPAAFQPDPLLGGYQGGPLSRETDADYDPTDTTYTWLEAFRQQLGTGPEAEWAKAINILRGWPRGEKRHCREVPALCDAVRVTGQEPTPANVWEYVQVRRPQLVASHA